MDNLVPSPQRIRLSPTTALVHSPLKRFRLDDGEPSTSTQSTSTQPCKIHKIRDHLSVRIPVDFRPYQTQSRIIEAILDASRDQKKLLIESPTGSGKTMALIIGALEALNGTGTDGASKPRKLIFCSRTHSQIQQTVIEMRRADFLLKNFKHTILAARANYCTNPKVRHEKKVNPKCNALVKLKGSINHDGKTCTKFCPMYRNLEAALMPLEEFRKTHIDSKIMNKPWNVDDLKEVLSEKIENYAFDLEDGPFYQRNATVFAHPDREGPKCPYFTARKLVASSDIIFAPYNYIMNHGIRKIIFGDEGLCGALLVIDEAHNIENMCRSEASFLISDLQIFEAIESIDNAITKASDSCLQFKDTPLEEVFIEKKEALKALKAYAIDVLDWLIQIGRAKLETQIRKRRSRKDDYPHQELNLDDLQPIKREQSELESLREAQKAVWESKFACKTGVLSRLFYFFENIDNPEYSDAFSMFVTMQKDPKSLDQSNDDEEDDEEDDELTSTPGTYKRNARLMNLKTKTQLTNGHFTFTVYCNSAHVVFHKTTQFCHAVVMASGTLSPLDGINQEFRTDFRQLKIEAKEVFHSARIFGAIIKQTNLSYNLDLTKKSIDEELHYDKESKTMQEALRIIGRICLMTPNGVLVFVSSYKMLDILKTELEAMDDGDFEKSLLEKKDCYFEESNSKQFNTMVEAYIKSANERGAILFAVCRAKMSEGIDFKDKLARAVVILGWPYPSIGDPQFKAKKAYDQKKYEASWIENPGTELLTGQQLVLVRLYRALNQAAGRAMRHKRDWGAIILLHNKHAYNYISDLVMNSLHASQQEDEVLQALKEWMQLRDAEKLRVS